MKHDKCLLKEMDTIILSDDSDEEVIVTSVKLKGRSAQVDSHDDGDIIFVASSKAKLNRQGNATVILSVPPNQSGETANGESSSPSASTSQNRELVDLPVQILDIEPQESSNLGSVRGSLQQNTGTLEENSVGRPLSEGSQESLGSFHTNVENVDNGLSLPKLTSDENNDMANVNENTNEDDLLNSSTSNSSQDNSLDTREDFYEVESGSKNFPVNATDKTQETSNDDHRRSLECDESKGHNFICQNLNLIKDLASPSQDNSIHTKEHTSRQLTEQENATLLQRPSCHANHLNSASDNQAGRLKLRLKRCYSVQQSDEVCCNDSENNSTEKTVEHFQEGQSQIPQLTVRQSSFNSSIDLPDLTDTSPSTLQNGVSSHGFTFKSNTGASSNSYANNRNTYDSAYRTTSFDFVGSSKNDHSVNNHKYMKLPLSSSVPNFTEDKYSRDLSPQSPIQMPDIHFVDKSNRKSKSKRKFKIYNGVSSDDDSDLEIPALSFGSYDSNAKSGLLNRDKDDYSRKESYKTGRNTKEFKTIFSNDIFSSDSENGGTVNDYKDYGSAKGKIQHKYEGHRSHRPKKLHRSSDASKNVIKTKKFYGSPKSITLDYREKTLKKFKFNKSKLGLDPRKKHKALLDKVINNSNIEDEQDISRHKSGHKGKHSKHERKHKDKGKRLKSKRHRDVRGGSVWSTTINTTNSLSDTDEEILGLQRIHSSRKWSVKVSGNSSSAKHTLELEDKSATVKFSSTRRDSEDSDIVIIKALPGKQGNQYTPFKKEPIDHTKSSKPTDSSNTTSSLNDLLKPPSFDLLFPGNSSGSSTSWNSTSRTMHGTGLSQTITFATGSSQTPRFVCNPPKCPSRRPDKPRVDMGSLLYDSDDDFQLVKDNVGNTNSNIANTASGTSSSSLSLSSHANKMLSNDLLTPMLRSSSSDNNIPYKKRKTSLNSLKITIDNRPSGDLSTPSVITSSTSSPSFFTSSSSAVPLGAHLEEKICYYCAMQKAKSLLSSCTKSHFCCGACLEDHAKEVLLGKKVKPPSLPSTSKTDNEAVNRCAKFLSSLHRLSRNGTYNNNNGMSLKVSESIQSLINGTQDPMQFMFTVQGILHGKNQPYLVAFLKKTLPMLQCKLFLNDITLEGYRPPPMRAIDLSLISQLSSGNTESKSSSSWSLQCRYPGCNSYFPMSELRKTLPSMVVDMLEEKLDQSFLDFMSDELMKNTDSSTDTSNSTDQVDSGTTTTAATSNLPEVAPLVIAPTGTDDTQDDSNGSGRSSDLPDHWDVMDENKDYEVFPLNPDSEEYIVLAAMFHDTMYFPNSEIVCIKRVQNPMLWRYYQLKKAKVVKDNPGIDVEKKLFHGTKKDVVEAICRENFDWRICGQNGTAFGQGSYFARDASYSHRYASESGFRSSNMNMRRAAMVSKLLAAQSSSGMSHQPPTKITNRLLSKMQLNPMFSGMPGQPSLPGSYPSPQSSAVVNNNNPVVSSSSSSSVHSSQYIPLPVNILPVTNYSLQQQFQQFSNPMLSQSVSSSAAPLSSSTSSSVPQGGSSRSNTRMMFVARVLTGIYTNGAPGYKRPPPLNSKDVYGRMYDSCVDNITNPQVFVVFEHQQCYPEYILEYKNRGGYI